jgi:hypothetical protein
MFVRPGILLDDEWVEEAARLIANPPGGCAAVFSAVPHHAARRSIVTDMMALLRSRFASPRPEQGLIIAKSFYDEVGGHRDGRGDIEADLLRRIGRGRIVTLRAGAVVAH